MRKYELIRAFWGKTVFLPLRKFSQKESIGYYLCATTTLINMKNLFLIIFSLGIFPFMDFANAEQANILDLQQKSGQMVKLQ